MPPIASPAAAALALKHNIDLSTLLNTCQASYLGVGAVEKEIDNRKVEEEQRAKRCRLGTMGTAELRAELKGLGVKSSFKGATHARMTCMLKDALDSADDPLVNVPPQFLLRQTLQERRRAEYKRMLEGCSLAQLAACLPTGQWQHFLAHGWLKICLLYTSPSPRDS